MKKAVIVGFGGMGGWHSRKIRENNVVELKGIFDIAERANKRAKDAGIYTYDSFESVLKDPDIDLVTVATPNDVHKDIVIALLNAGKNIICEKPVTMTEKDFWEMAEAAKKNGCVFTVHQNRRWGVGYWYDTVDGEPIAELWHDYNCRHTYFPILLEMSTSRHFGWRQLHQIQ